MPRRRVAVALLPPAALARSVQVLRRAFADPRLDDLPPHLTLVPPINLASDAWSGGRALLRSVATDTVAFDLLVGPAATFAPATPTLHLDLQGDAAALHDLRERVRSGPFHRSDVWPFHPHVTLREELLDPAPATVAASMPGVLGGWHVDRVHLLEQRRTELGRPRWVPVAEEPFGPPVVVGRGGIELELRATTMVPEEAAMLLGGASPPADPFASDLVISATNPGARCEDPPLGVAVGRLCGRRSGHFAPAGTTSGVALAELTGVVVGSSVRGQGVGRHLLARFCHEAATRGAQMVVAALGDDPAAGLLVSEGFVQVGSAHVRQLGPE